MATPFSKDLWNICIVLSDCCSARKAVNMAKMIRYSFIIFPERRFRLTYASVYSIQCSFLDGNGITDRFVNTIMERYRRIVNDTCGKFMWEDQSGMFVIKSDLDYNRLPIGTNFLSLGIATCTIYSSLLNTEVDQIKSSILVYIHLDQRQVNPVVHSISEMLFKAITHGLIYRLLDCHTIHHILFSLEVLASNPNVTYHICLDVGDTLFFYGLSGYINIRISYLSFH